MRNDAGACLYHLFLATLRFMLGGAATNRAFCPVNQTALHLPDEAVQRTPVFLTPGVFP